MCRNPYKKKYNKSKGKSLSDFLYDEDINDEPKITLLKELLNYYENCFKSNENRIKEEKYNELFNKCKEIIKNSNF